MQPVMWEATKWPAIEYFSLKDKGEHRIAAGHINGIFEGTPFSVQYEIELLPDWRISHFHIRANGQDERSLKLTHDLNGHWFDKDGNHIEAFDGCMDIDISLTPFTNTLPIKRLTFESGEAKELDMLYIRLPEFELQQIKQRYTRLGERSYLYENMHNTFSATLPFDDNGVVTDYPGIFRRIYPMY